MALEFVAGRPAAATGAVVRRYAGYRERTGEPLHRRERAGLIVPLILAFGPEIEVAPAGAPRQRLGAFVGGPATTWVDTWHAGEQFGVQVDLDLVGARRVLGGMPMAELADRVVPLEDVFGADGRRLLEALAGAPSWPLRFALVDAFLARRLAAAPLPPPDLVRAWRRLGETGGRLGIGALAAELGCSRRHLTARFREHVGVPPRSPPACCGSRARWTCSTPASRWPSRAAGGLLRPAAPRPRRPRPRGRDAGGVRGAPLPNVQDAGRGGGLAWAISTRRSSMVTQASSIIPYCATATRRQPSTGSSAPSAWSGAPSTPATTAPSCTPSSRSAEAW